MLMILSLHISSSLFFILPVFAVYSYFFFGVPLCRYFYSLTLGQSETLVLNSCWGVVFSMGVRGDLDTFNVIFNWIVSHLRSGTQETGWGNRNGVDAVLFDNIIRLFVVCGILVT
jgi:hypothetical protein